MREEEIRAIVVETLHEQRKLAGDDNDPVVLQTIATILKSFGIEEEDRKEIKKDLQHLRRWRRSVEQVQAVTFKTAIIAIVTGLMGALWLGIKTLISIKGGA